jgi:hypothetical protein
MTFWQMEMDSQGSGASYRKMARMWVETRPYYGNDTARQYDDRIGQPSATTSGGDCTSRTAGVSAASGDPVNVGVTYSWTHTDCEMYGPVMYDDAGHYAATWHGNPEVDSDVVRNVVMVKPVYTYTREGNPLWTMLDGQEMGHTQ